MKYMGVYNPGPKKRNIKVLALAVVCVILAASLVGVIAVYTLNGNSADLKAQITTKDNMISSLQANNTALQSNITQTQALISYYTNQLGSLNQQLTSLNDQVSGYYNIAIMNVSSILFSQQPITQDANSTTQVFSDVIYYSGYVAIQSTASANTTYAEVIYSYGGTNFDYNQTLGTSGNAVFPVLPGTLTINIGNINQATSNTVTASATYYY
jgi:flagellar basal body-associated protein FliL